MSIPALQFTITEIKPRIFHIEFNFRRDLAQSMMRLQEFYEGVSDDIRGKYFTLEEFMHHFTSEDGEFEYTNSWSGFNVPGHVVTQWVELFDSQPERLTNKERQIMTALFQKISGNEPWYLIATSIGVRSQEIVNHEVAHGRYYLNESYRVAVDCIISEMDEFERNHISDSLKEMGYHDSVINDEIQAYLSTSSKPDIRHWFGKLQPDTLNLVEKFRKNYKKTQ